MRVAKATWFSAFALGLSVSALSASAALAHVTAACPGGGDKHPSYACPGDDKSPSACPGDDKSPSACPGDDKSPSACPGGGDKHPS